MGSAESCLILGNIFYGLPGRGMDALDSRRRNSDRLNDLPAYLRVFKERVSFK